jgi:hypothetical protein
MFVKSAVKILESLALLPKKLVSLHSLLENTGMGVYLGSINACRLELYLLLRLINQVGPPFVDLEVYILAAERGFDYDFVNRSFHRGH